MMLLPLAAVWKVDFGVKRDEAKPSQGEIAEGTYGVCAQCGADMTPNA